jgi:ATP-binding cassette subfamily B protein
MSVEQTAYRAGCGRRQLARSFFFAKEGGVVQKSEFTVQDAYPYNRSSPLRWIVSHIWRYKFFTLTALLLYTNAWLVYAGARVVIGRAAEEIMHPSSPDGLLWLALAVVGLLAADGFSMLFGSYAAEKVAGR